MGPSSGDDGNLDLTLSHGSQFIMLQWGRRLVTTEI